jgi:hypothetical protein
MLKNLKSIISPIQDWLLAKGQCVGCGMPLSKGRIQAFKKDKTKVTCKCGRIYLFDAKEKKYQRALSTDV